jgi:hypothetical protein
MLTLHIPIRHRWNTDIGVFGYSYTTFTEHNADSIYI